MFTRDLKEFVELLIKQRVEYLIIGGYAVGVHRHMKYAGYLDIRLNHSGK